MTEQDLGCHRDVYFGDAIYNLYHLKARPISARIYMLTCIIRLSESENPFVEANGIALYPNILNWFTRNCCGLNVYQQGAYYTHNAKWRHTRARGGMMMAWNSRIIALYLR